MQIYGNLMEHEQGMPVQLREVSLVLTLQELEMLQKFLDEVRRTVQKGDGLCDHHHLQLHFPDYQGPDVIVFPSKDGGLKY